MTRPTDPAVEVVPLEQLLAEQQTGPGLPSIEYQTGDRDHDDRDDDREYPIDTPTVRIGGRVVVTPEGHEPSLTCPCGPVLGVDGLMHTLESDGDTPAGVVELDPAAGTVTIRGLSPITDWVFVQVGPEAYEWRPANDGTSAGVEVTGAQLVAAERLRQVMMEGYTEDHDRRHGVGALAQAAYCYEVGAIDSRWPWQDAEFKPKNRLRDYIRAAALYQAAADISPSQQRARYFEGTRDRVIGYIDGILDEARHVLGGGA